MSSKVFHTKVDVFKPHQQLKKEDLLAVEEPMEIRLGFGQEKFRQQKNISITMRTPGNDFELAAGFLFTEGIINTYDDIQSIVYCNDPQKLEERENVVRVELAPLVKIDLKKLERHFYTTSSCGICGKTSLEALDQICKTVLNEGPVIDAETLASTISKLRASQQVFEYTGGLHAAALFDTGGNLIMIREDIGRHNAVDKLIGACLAAKMVPLSEYLLLVSGRAGFELIQKALAAGVPLMAAIGAPSSLSVQAANQYGMTLIGFLKDQQFNLYSCPHRISKTFNKLD